MQGEVPDKAGPFDEHPAGESLSKADKKEVGARWKRDLPIPYLRKTYAKKTSTVFCNRNGRVFLSLRAKHSFPVDY